jgi:hypothetical protein
MINDLRYSRVAVELFKKLANIRDALQSSGASKVGNLDDLTTTDKNNAVAAINEVNAYNQQQDRKLETLNGHYFPLDAFDFGKSIDVKTPNPADVTDLNTYAITMIPGASTLEDIIDGTVIKNLFDGVEYVWNAASQVWLDWGIGNIVTAGNDHLGVVEGTADPGDGSKDGAVTVLSGGTMEVIGFAALKAQTGEIDAALDLINGETV